jgi:hypothetical protein
MRHIEKHEYFNPLKDVKIKREAQVLMPVHYLKKKELMRVML